MLLWLRKILLVNVIASNYFGNNRYSFNEIFAIKGGMEGYILMLLFIFCSYFALSKAIVKIPISTAYAIWEGIGLIGTATVAYFIFNEDLSLLKVLALW